MGADITLRASLWLTIFVCMLIRYTGVDTTWDRSLHIDGVSNSTAEIVTSIHVSNMLGLFVLGVHIVMVFPLLVYIWYQHVIKLGTAMTILVDTLLSWTLLVQVAVTGADISLYATGAVTYFVLGLDLAISFNVVLYQSLIRIIPLESLPAHLEHGATGQITLSNRFLDDEEEEQGEYQGEPI